MPRCRFALPWALIAAALSLPAQEPPRCRLEGQTVDALQRPLPNCRLTVEAEGAVLATTFSDATGLFVVGRLPQRHVVVRAVTGAEVGAIACGLAGIDSGFVRLPVYPGRTLRGHVRDGAGAPIAGAFVLAAPIDLAELGVIDACAETSADGSYILPHVLAGPVQVRVWAPSHELSESLLEGADDAVFDCELLPDPLREVTFQLDGATPAQLAAARLLVAAERRANYCPVPLPPPLRVLRPDAEGRCVVRGWSAHDRLIGRFVVPDTTVSPPLLVAPAGPIEWQCRAAVQPDDLVRGVLRAPDGRGLGNRLLLCRPLDDAHADLVGSFGRTDADGRFALAAPVATGERFALRAVAADLAIAHADSRDAGSRSWYVASHDAAAVHEVPAQPAPAVQLRVLGPDGLAVRGAIATLLDDRAPQAGRRGWPQQFGRGSSDAEGRIELHGIDLSGTGELRLRLSAPAGVGEVLLRAETGGAALALGDVQLGPAATCAGVVLGADGRPAVGARVQVVSLEDEMRIRTVLTGRDGRFAVVGLAPGYCAVQAFVGGGPGIRGGNGNLAAGEVTDLELRAR